MEGVGGRGGGKDRAKQGRAFLCREWNSMDAQRILGLRRPVTHNDVRLMSNPLSVQKPDAVTKNIFPSLISSKWSSPPLTVVFAECPCSGLPQRVEGWEQGRYVGNHQLSCRVRKTGALLKVTKRHHLFPVRMIDF